MSDRVPLPGQAGRAQAGVLLVSRARWATLFDARFDVLLYDLTSLRLLWSGPPFDGKRRFGRSPGKRSDCVQVVIALIVTPDGSRWPMK